MSGITDFLGRAVEEVRKAIELDNAGEYEKALQLYTKALELFMLAAKWEKNAKSKEMIRQKAGEYMDRAEKLKTYLAENEKGPKKTAAAGVNGAGKTKSGGSADEGSNEKETTALRKQLMDSIMFEKPDVRWESVAGLEEAKNTLKEAVILPIKFPQLFSGGRAPWRGILMYGPPGTGKTHLARAVATEANSTFFSVSSSNLTSKWLGDSEKLVRELFMMARENKPAVIFLDEIDALVSPRSEGESEASRRIKTEFLVQMDGVKAVQDGVLLLAATNIPWNLDTAILRRFQRKVHIGLPDAASRAELFKLAIKSTETELHRDDYHRLAEMSENFSGSDISIAVQKALMRPIRLVMEATHFKYVDENGAQKLTPCSPGDPGAKEMTYNDVEGDDLLPPTVRLQDFINAVKDTKPSVTQADKDKHNEWTEQYGTEGAV